MIPDSVNLNTTLSLIVEVTVVHVTNERVVKRLLSLETERKSKIFENENIAKPCKAVA